MTMIFGENWFLECQALCANVEAFLHTRGLDPTAVVHHILQVVCSTREDAIKTSVLGALQLHAAVLLGADRSAQEHTITSLEAVLLQSAHHETSTTSLPPPMSPSTGAAQGLPHHDAASTTAHGELFRGQILVTLTHLLIELNLLRDSPETFERVVQLLLRIISKVNSPLDRITRSFACQSLRELELQYPGLLARRCNHLLLMMDGERTHVRDAYASLYVVVLRHTTIQLAAIEATKTSSSKPILTDSLLLKRWQNTKTFDEKDTNMILLTGEEQQRAAYMVPSILLSQALSMASCNSFVAATTPTTVEATPDHGLRASTVVVTTEERWHREVRRAVSVLFDTTCQLSAHNLASCLLALMECVAICQLSPVVYKQQFYRLVANDSLILQHVVVLMKSRFQTSLLDEADERALLYRLMSSLGDPLTSIEGRLLYARWLSSYPLIHPPAAAARAPFLSGKVSVRDPATKQVDVRVKNAYELYLKLVPSIFDTPQVMEARLCACAKGFVPIGRGDALSRGASIPSVQCLRDCRACLSGYEADQPRGRRIMALFRATHCYGKQFSRALRASVHAAVLELVLDRPKFAPAVIQLVDGAVKHGDVFAGLLVSVVGALTAMSSAAFMRHSREHLLLLERAAREVDINPAGFLRSIHLTLRSSPVCADGNWDIGNHLLAVCRAAMATHSAAEARMALSDVLRVILEQHEDVDIRDRARFYLSLFAHATGDRLARILALPSTAADVAALTTGGVKPATTTTTAAATSDADEDQKPQAPYMGEVDGAPTVAPQEFPRAKLPQETSEQWLQLKRSGPTRPFIELAKITNATTATDNTISTATALDDVELAKAYFVHVASAQYITTMALPIKVSIKDKDGAPARMYAITVSFTCSEERGDLLCEDIPEISIPYLQRLSDDENQYVFADVEVVVTPWEPTPLVFAVRGCYTDDQGDTHLCRGGSLELQFEDLFLPAMLPPTMPTSELLEDLFRVLWTQFCDGNVSPLTGDACAESVKRLRGHGATLMSRVAAKLERFSVNAQRTKFIIFLSPSYHVLLKFSDVGDAVVARFCTDYSKVLGRVETYLQSLENL